MPSMSAEQNVKAGLCRLRCLNAAKGEASSQAASTGESRVDERSQACLQHLSSPPLCLRRSEDCYQRRLRNQWLRAGKMEHTHAHTHKAV